MDVVEFVWFVILLVIDWFVETEVFVLLTWSIILLFSIVSFVWFVKLELTVESFVRLVAFITVD